MFSSETIFTYFKFSNIVLLIFGIARKIDLSDAVESIVTHNKMQCSETGEYVQRTSYLPEDQTVHGAHIAEVHDVPMSVIIRPIPPVLDEQKVLSLMETIKVIYFISFPRKLAHKGLNALSLVLLKPK